MGDEANPQLSTPAFRIARRRAIGVTLGFPRTAASRCDSMMSCARPASSSTPSACPHRARQEGAQQRRPAHRHRRAVHRDRGAHRRLLSSRTSRSFRASRAVRSARRRMAACRRARRLRPSFRWSQNDTTATWRRGPTDRSREPATNCRSWNATIVVIGGKCLVKYGQSDCGAGSVEVLRGPSARVNRLGGWRCRPMSSCSTVLL